MNFRVVRLILVSILVSILFPSGAGAQDNPSSDIRDKIDKAQLMFQYNIKNAVTIASQALSEALQVGDSMLITECYSTMGRGYSLLGSFDQSFQNYSRAYEFCPKGAPTLEARLCSNLSRFYRLVKNFDSALLYAEKAHKFYLAVGDSAGIASYYNDRGLIYVNMDRNDDAERDFMHALQINRSLGLKSAVVRNLNNLALYDNGDPYSKIKLLKEAIQYNDSVGNHWALGENYNNLGVQYFHARRYEDALRSLNSAREYSLKMEARELICDNYRYFSWVYSAMGRYREAYDNLLKMYEIEQGIFSERLLTEAEISRLSNNLAVSEQQRLIDSQDSQLKVMRRNTLIIVIVIIALVSILIITNVAWRSRKKVYLLNIEIAHRTMQEELSQGTLESKKNQLIAISLHMRTRLHIINKIKDMLKECQRANEEQIREQLRRVITFITNQQFRDKEVDTLTGEIEAICSEFLIQLKKLHPELTKNELQLAVFLRINMSSKEISLLTGTTEKSVNMARYRLRKHFLLATDVSLHDYIQSI